MPENKEDFYKREEDRKWRESVESRIVSLTSAQKATDDDIDEIAGKLEVVDELLHGDRKERDSGLVGTVNAIETGLIAIQRIMYEDRLGHGGLINEHRTIKDLVFGKEKRAERRWGFYTAFALAVIGNLWMLVKIWPDISSHWEEEGRKNRIVAQRIERAKYRRKVIPRIRVVPANSGAPQEPEPQEGKQ